MSFWNKLGYVVKVKRVDRMNDPNLETVSFVHWFRMHTTITIAGAYRPGDLAVFIKNGVKVPDGFDSSKRKDLCTQESAFNDAKASGDPQTLIASYTIINQLRRESKYECFWFLRKMNYIVQEIVSPSDPEVKSEGILINIMRIPQVNPSPGADCTNILSLEKGVNNG